MLLTDGLYVFVKRACPTCELVAPALTQIAARQRLTAFSQDDPSFPPELDFVNDDTNLDAAYRFNIETVPTLMKIENGKSTARAVGWNRAEWSALSGVEDLAPDLPEMRPGCGSRNTEPGMAVVLALRFGEVKLDSREIEIGDAEDLWEACYDRGWSDGLPVVPPTPERLVRMLKGTTRKPDEELGLMPPNRVPVTVEKVALNAVLAGCRPEYMPFVLAAVEAALDDVFCLKGLTATTWFSTPVVIVSGPGAKKIGMNCGVNAMGQGNRANAGISRALNLLVRNVGGGVPGGVDRSCLGTPGKYTFCFAENVEDSPWVSLSEEKGFSKEATTVTLFGGDGVQGVFDQQSREPESLARTFAACLQGVLHPKLVMGSDAVLVVSPEHARVFREAGWSKENLKTGLSQLLTRRDEVLVRGAGGMAEGIPFEASGKTFTKFKPGGLTIVHAGGGAGMFSAIIGGWPASGPVGSTPVTREVHL